MTGGRAVPVREVSIATVTALRERAAALGITLSDAAARELANAAVAAELPNLLAAVRRQLVNAFERIERNETAPGTAPTAPMPAIPDQPPARRHYELAPDPTEPEDFGTLVRQRLGSAVPGAPPVPPPAPEPYRPEAAEPEEREAPPLRRSLFGGRRGQAEAPFDGPDRRAAERRQDDVDDDQRPIFKRPRR
jgi:hypothetical protein